MVAPSRLATFLGGFILKVGPGIKPGILWRAIRQAHHCFSQVSRPVGLSGLKIVSSQAPAKLGFLF